MSPWLISRPRYLNLTAASVMPSSMRLFFLERKGGPCSQHLLQHADPPPHRRRADARHIAGRHQQLRLVGIQRFGRLGRVRPPYEPSLGKPLRRQPVSLAVIAEETNRGPTAAPKHENASGEWIFGELVLAKPRQGINPLASVDRFDRH